MDRGQPIRSALNDLLCGDAGSLLDSLMSFLPLGLTIADAPDVRILRVSDAGADLLGLPRSYLESISLEAHTEAYRIEDPLTGEPPPPENLPLSRATLKGEVVRNEEWVLRSAGGDEIVILCNAGPVRNETGEVIGGLIAWSDITEKKELERKLTEAVATRERLLAELYHRISNHLQIVGAIVRVEARQAADTAALVSKVEDRIVALGRAYSVFRGIAEEVPAAEFLSQICQPLETSSVRIELTADAALRISGAHAPVLGIVVNEAVCNAIKHAFPEGRCGRVTVSLNEEAGRVVLRVADDGIGMNPSAAAPGQGRGLLALLMKGVGGAITVTSTPGEGTTITACWDQVNSAGSAIEEIPIAVQPSV